MQTYKLINDAPLLNGFKSLVTEDFVLKQVIMMVQ